MKKPMATFNRETTSDWKGHVLLVVILVTILFSEGIVESIMLLFGA